MPALPPAATRAGGNTREPKAQRPVAASDTKKHQNGDTAPNGTQHGDAERRQHKCKDDGSFHFSKVLAAMAMRSEESTTANGGSVELVSEQTTTLLLGSLADDDDGNGNGNDDSVAQKLKRQLRAEQNERASLERKVASLTDALTTATTNLELVAPTLATKTAHAIELEDTIGRLLKLKLQDDERFCAQTEEAEKLLLYWHRQSTVFASRTVRLEKDLATASEEKKEAGVQHELVLNELEQSSAEKEELTGKVSKLEEELERATSGAMSARAQAAEEAEALKTENADLRNRNKALQDQVATLQDTVEGLTSDMQKASEQMNALVQQHDAVQESMSESDAVRKDLERRVTVLSTDLEETQTRAAELQSRLENVTAERDVALEDGSNTQNELEGQVSVLSTDLRENQYRAAELQSRLENVTAERDAALEDGSNTQKELEGQVAVLSTDLEENQYRAAELQLRLENVTAERDSALEEGSNTQNELEGQVAVLSTDLRENQYRAAELQSRLENMTAERDAALEEGSNTQNELEGQVSVLSTDLRETQTRAAELQLQLENVTAERDAALEEGSNTQKLLVEVQSQLSFIATERDCATAEREQTSRALDEEKEAAVSQVERLRKQLGDAEATVVDLMGEVSDLKHTAALLATERDDLAGRNATMAALNQELVEERNRVATDLDNMTQSYKSSQENVKASNALVDRLETQVHAMHANLMQERHDGQTKFENAAQEHAQFQLQLSAAIETMGTLKADMTRANEREQEANGRAAAMAGQRDELAGQVERLREEMEQLYAEAHKTKDQAAKHMDELSRQNIDLLDHNKALGDQLAALNSTASEKQTTNQEQTRLLAEQAAASQRHAAELRTQYEAMLAERDGVLRGLQQSQSTVDRDMRKMAQEAENLVVTRTAQLREDLARAMAELTTAKSDAERYRSASDDAKANGAHQSGDLVREVKRLKIKVHQLTREKDDLQSRATKQIEVLERLLRTEKGVHIDVTCQACGTPLNALFRTPDRKRRKGTVWDRLHKSGTYASNAHLLGAEASPRDPSLSSPLPMLEPTTPSTPASTGLTTPKKPRPATRRDLETTFRQGVSSA